jgi:hypothetical protein
VTRSRSVEGGEICQSGTAAALSKPDDRGNRRYYKQVRDVGRGAHSRHIGAEKAPCTVLLRNCRS